MTRPAILPFPRRRKSLVAGRRWDLEWERFKNNVVLARKWWLRPHTAYQPFFVIATCRSGSNLLLSYLSQQPQIAALSEVLCPQLAMGPSRYAVSPRRAIKHIRYSLQGERAAVRGAKLMLHQLAADQLTLDGLDAAFPNARYIILYRQSLAEQFVSQEVAMSTRQFLVFEGQERKQTRVKIDPDKLRKFCEGVRTSYAEAINHDWLKDRAVLLSYEELTADPDYWLNDQIWPLLEVPAIPPQTNLVKQNTRPFHEQVTNYSQVAALLTSPLCQQYHAWPWQRNPSARPSQRRRAA